MYDILYSKESYSTKFNSFLDGFSKYKDSVLNVQLESSKINRKKYDFSKIKACSWDPRYDHKYLPNLYVKVKNFATARVRSEFLTCFYLNGEKSKKFEILKYEMYNSKTKFSYFCEMDNISSELISMSREGDKKIRKYFVKSIIIQDEIGEVFEIKCKFRLLDD